MVLSQEEGKEGGWEEQKIKGACKLNEERRESLTYLLQLTQIWLGSLVTLLPGLSLLLVDR